MKSIVLLLAAEDSLAAAVLAALPDLTVLRCRDMDAAIGVCRDRQPCLAVIVDAPPAFDGRQAFADLGAAVPGLAGILLTPAMNNILLQDALEAGFSGVAELPVNGGTLSRLVNQALERAALLQENTRLRTLIPLYSLGEQFLSATSEKEILDRLTAAVGEQTGATHISVMLHDPDQDCLRVAAFRGMNPLLAQSICLAPGDRIAGWVFKEGTPVILNREDQEGSIFSPLLAQPEIDTAICFPLKVRQEILGVLNISQKQTDTRFSEADNEMLAIICSQAAAALDNVRSLAQLRATIRTRTLFEQYVAPEVAELLLAQHADLMELGEIKEVTVLFADIRNFTRLVQHVELEEMRLFLNEFFQSFTEAVFQCRGTVDKFMGDAVLAVFGAPVKLDQPALAAVRAAWSIKARFTELRAQWMGRGPEFAGVDLGIAVTCGRVFLGNMGSARRLDYTVIGHAVNIAQRLAAESTDCRIYLSEAVQQAVSARFAVREQGEMRLRGVEDPVRVYWVEAERTERP